MQGHIIQDVETVETVVGTLVFTLSNEGSHYWRDLSSGVI